MFTKITSTEEFQQLFVEALLNKTDKITKISPHSVNSGIGFGIAEVGRMCLKEVALVESHLFPDVSVEEALDDVANYTGIAPRFGNSGSTTYVRIFAAVGTQYLAGVHVFSGVDGIKFDLLNDVTIGDNGYAYAKVSSQDKGENTNVNALTIKNVNPVPNGHVLVVNEFKAIGGRDAESDDLFRKRIKSGSNILAQKTLAMIEQVFMKFNPDVLKVFNGGTDVNGKIVLFVALQNGANLSDNDIAILLDGAKGYFNLVDLKPYIDQSLNIKIMNAEFDLIDIAMRIELQAGVNSDDIRNELQIRFNKILDFRNWDILKGRVDWVDLISISRSIKGVKYVPDNYFFINNKTSDYLVSRGKLPRIRGFVLYNTDGSILSDNNNQLSSVYYPNQLDLAFQSTVL